MWPFTTTKVVKNINVEPKTLKRPEPPKAQKVWSNSGVSESSEIESSDESIQVGMAIGQVVADFVNNTTIDSTPAPTSDCNTSYTDTSTSYTSTDTCTSTMDYSSPSN